MGSDVSITLASVIFNRAKCCFALGNESDAMVDLEQANKLLTSKEKHWSCADLDLDIYRIDKKNPFRPTSDLPSDISVKAKVLTSSNRRVAYKKFGSMGNISLDNSEKEERGSRLKLRKGSLDKIEVDVDLTVVLF